MFQISCKIIVLAMAYNIIFQFKTEPYCETKLRINELKIIEKDVKIQEPRPKPNIEDPLTVKADLIILATIKNTLATMFLSVYV